METLQHTQTWNQYFAPMHSLNFSIYSDETQNTLWRVQNGALDNVKPKVSLFRLKNFLFISTIAFLFLSSILMLISLVFRIDRGVARWNE